MAISDTSQPPSLFVLHCRQIVSLGFYKIQAKVPGFKTLREYMQASFPATRKYLVEQGNFEWARTTVDLISVQFLIKCIRGFSLTQGATANLSASPVWLLGELYQSSDDQEGKLDQKVRFYDGSLPITSCPRKLSLVDTGLRRTIFLLFVCQHHDLN
jgi:hypothetical protein